MSAPRPAAGAGSPNGALRIGTAGWSIPREWAERFPATGSHLERYAQIFDAVEINSSFYRPHRRTTYVRWAASVPENFRVAVKIPREITHLRRLRDVGAPLALFLAAVSGLGEKLGVLLVQLPPGLAFDPLTAGTFLADLAGRAGCAIACEPRHPSWFAADPQALLAELRIARVAADPPVVAGAGQGGGWPGLLYLRLHGAPVIYRSSYGEADIAAAVGRMAAATAAGAAAWCIFDNTADFAATGNALCARAMAGRAAAG